MAKARKLRTWAGRGKGRYLYNSVWLFRAAPKTFEDGVWRGRAWIDTINVTGLYRLTGIRPKPGELVELPEREAI